MMKEAMTVKVWLDKMYEKPHDTFYYPHPEPKNLYFLTSSNYRVPEILECMIEDVKNVFYHNLAGWEDSGWDHPTDLPFLEELLQYYLWLLKPDKTDAEYFSHFNLDHRHNDKLTVYIRFELDGTKIRLKPWVEIGSLEPIVTPFLEEKYPNLTKDDLSCITSYLFDILWNYSFKKDTKRPIAESYTKQWDDSFNYHEY